MVFVVALAYYVITREAAASGFTLTRAEGDSLSRPTRISFTTPTSYRGGGVWTLVFAYYCLTIHILVSSFPLRSMWSIFDISRCLERTASSKSLKDYKLAHRRRGSFTSLSSSETLTSSKELPSPTSTAGSEAGDTETEFVAEIDNGMDRVIHAIIIPNYKEEIDTLRETLDVMASHPFARDTYDVSRWAFLAIGPGFVLLLALSIVLVLRDVGIANKQQGIPSNGVPRTKWRSQSYDDNSGVCQEVSVDRFHPPPI